MPKSSPKNPKYPKNWKKIASLLKEEENFYCENCHHEHNPEKGFTLTVHHFDFNPENCDRKNLVVLCQRCHLSIQSRIHPGQLWLFDVKPDWLKERGY